MLGTVKHVDLSRNRFGSNKVRVLRHIARPVDFALVVDFLNNLNAGLWRDGVATEFATLIIVVRSIKFVCRWAVVAFRKMDFSDLDVVLGLARRVGA